ncbi:metaxin-1-like isoform X2 [Paramacrobiotus metropolitanus]|uniref:metaxin-1-like isoform X2 n=1 Tax=Paramacrobiotus metropolitanus TaxID=2943436 RepID=UPI0024457AA3|nr:metaxin-1-like isoform X2 [Paramacrobiotus metropolitanus]
MPAKDGKYQLTVWKGSWDIPSVDPECLRAITFARLSDVPVSLMVDSAPWKTASQTYPILTIPNGYEYHGAENVVRFLQTEGYRCPYEASQMTSYEYADAYALETYLRSALLPLLDYLWWVDDEVFRHVTLPFYQKELSYYGQFVWMHQQRKKVRARLHLTPDALLNPDNVDQIRSQIMKKAKRCLEDLSVKLSDKTFLFGLKPSAVDATAFAYLSVMFYVPWKSKHLNKEFFSDRETTDKFRNLKAFVDRVRKRYLQDWSFVVETVVHPVYWYHRFLNKIREHSDTLVFLAAAAALNAYLFRRTIKRLRV